MTRRTRVAPLANAVHRIPFDGPADRLPSVEEVGAKAHNLMRLARCGLPVPPGFVLGTEVCRGFLGKGTAALDGLDEVLERELQQLGARTGHYFGDGRRPLLLSVRSGAAVSMPGMMETVLNIGLTDTTLRGLIRMTGNPRLAHDCRRRLLQQYGEVVHAMAPARFGRRLDALLAEAGAADDELDTAGLDRVAQAFASEFALGAGGPMPVDPHCQLRAAVEAVFRSWNGPRAQSYRALNGIPDDLGTAAIVQTMVFGNMGPGSGSGVGFSRSPADGANAPYVDYLPNAQGEDVVAGRRRALGVDELARRAPDAHRALMEAQSVLEREFRDMQDFEFTVEKGQLFLLQSRTGKRTPLAALRIAHDLVEEGLITPAEALARVGAVDIDTIETLSLNPAAGLAALACGTPASVGVAVGRVVFDPQRVPARKSGGEPVILARETAETGDIAALTEAAALITAEGARTSHAAVVARQLGKVCVVGCAGLAIDPSGRRAVFGETMVEEGHVLSVDGISGRIYPGTVEVRRERPKDLLAHVEAWRAAAAGQ